MRFILILMLIPNLLFADDEPGGWVEPGGYDYKAVEAKAAKEKKEAEEKAKKVLNNKKAKITAYQKTPEYFNKLNDIDLCIKSGILERKNSDITNVVYAEIKKRNFPYTPKHPAVLKKHVQIGMSDCELLASWGKPDRINKHVTARHIHKQHVYYRTYVYSDDGFVTSWQE
ncbi:hypothetical protein Q9292_09975 [Methylophilus sp. VKM B-3414]|uniref:hypothetical protein n=1 Tax=Methylophilus sp. VKM B-3414 TaxID=3076121 RepID=UPI0028C79B61|nr:hypothetical protein [Methylophilus sp. VKM B-3414]MDT7849938.1 hypothetical protein [Methylophilus sp. VKM B-3414]